MHENTSKVWYAHKANSFNSTSIVAPAGIFIVFLAFCLLRCYTLSLYVPRYSPCPHLYEVRSSLRQRAIPSRDRDIAVPRSDAAQLYHRLPFSPRWSFHWLWIRVLSTLAEVTRRLTFHRRKLFSLFCCLFSRLLRSCSFSSSSLVLTFIATQMAFLLRTEFLGS